MSKKMNVEKKERKKETPQVIYPEWFRFLKYPAPQVEGGE